MGIEGALEMAKGAKNGGGRGQIDRLRVRILFVFFGLLGYYGFCPEHRGCVHRNEATRGLMIPVV